jgi:hypothetical protein
MLVARVSHCENYDSPQPTVGSRASSRALYLDQSRLDMTLDDDIRPFTSVLRLQALKCNSKITSNTQNTLWPLLAPPDHANAQPEPSRNRNRVATGTSRNRNRVETGTESQPEPNRNRNRAKGPQPSRKRKIGFTVTGRVEPTPSCRKHLLVRYY